MLKVVKYYKILPLINIRKLILFLSQCHWVIGANSVKPGSHRLVTSLTTTEGQPVAQHEQDLASQRVVVLDTSSIPPGRYQIHLRVTDAEGRFYSEEARDIEAIPGPNF